MRLLLFLLLLYPSFVQAWATMQSSQGNTTGGGQQGAYNRFITWKNSGMWDGVDPNKHYGAVYLTGFSQQSSFYNTWRYHAKYCFHTAYNPRCNTVNFAVTDLYDFNGNQGHFSISDYQFDLPKTLDEECTSKNSETQSYQRVFKLDSQPTGFDPVTYNDDKGCLISVSMDTVWQSPDGSWYGFYDYTGAAPEITAPEDFPPDFGQSPYPDHMTPTTDPALDCPWSNVTMNGQTYCYNGSDKNEGKTYADSSIRVDHYDGSYTVTTYDGQGNSTTNVYNSNGTLKNPGTAPTTPEGKNLGSWKNKATTEGFDLDSGAALIQSAKDNLSTKVNDIKSQMSAKFNNFGSGGGSCSSPTIAYAGAVHDLDFCGKVDQWGATVRTAVLLLAAILAFMILLRVRE